MKFFILGCLTTLVLIAIAGYFFLYLGLLNFQADQSPSAFETKYAGAALDASMTRHAPDAKNPIPTTEANLLDGTKLYQAHCAVCHGGPADSRSGVLAVFYPRVPQFTMDAPDMPDNHNFYIIKHGIRWTGMPAWGNQLTDDQIWKLAAFLSQMAKLPPAVDQEWKKSSGAAKTGVSN